MTDFPLFGRSPEFELELCQLLGLDPNVTRSIDLIVTSGDLMRVEIEQFVPIETALELVKRFQSYLIFPLSKTVVEVEVSPVDGQLSIFEVLVPEEVTDDISGS